MSSATLSRPTFQASNTISNIVGGLPLSVTWSLGDSPNTAEIQVPRKRIQEFRHYNAGKSVYIKVRRNLTTKRIFQGYITGRYLDFSPNDENVTEICQGPRWMMSGDFLKGRHILNKDGNYRVLHGLKCIFNEALFDSQIAPGNSATARAARGVYPFALNPRSDTDSRAFTVNDMLWYSYYIGRTWKGSEVVSDCLSISRAGVGDVGDLAIYDVDVDGLDITTAFDVIMRKAGLKWWCRPISNTKSEVKAFLSGPAADTPRKYLYLANVSTGVAPGSTPILADVSSSTNNIEAGRLNEDFSEVANEVYGYGARKLWQDEFTLKPGWDNDTWTELTGLGDIELIRAELRESSSSDWDKYKDIGRKWILDESGEVTGEAYDFSGVFDGGEQWAQIARPFAGQLVDGDDFAIPWAKNPANEDEEPLEMNVRMLEHQAGVYIEGDELVAPLFVEVKVADVNPNLAVITPVPLLATELKFYAAVPWDKALFKGYSESGAQSSDTWQVGINPNSDGTHSEVDRRMPLVVDDEYQTDDENEDKETEVEEKLEDLVLRKLDANKNPRVSASFSLPFICTSYEPGDVIIGIRGRRIYFTAQINEVRFDLGESQRTELVLEDMRLAEY